MDNVLQENQNEYFQPENLIYEHDKNKPNNMNEKYSNKKIFNLGGINGNIIGAKKQLIKLNNSETTFHNKIFEEQDLDQEMDSIFGPDESFNPIIKEVNHAHKIANNYLEMIKMKFPNRYFILKKTVQDPIHWEACLQKNYVIITDINYAKKLQNSYKVIIIIQISDNVYLIFMSVDNKEFLGYARVDSNIQCVTEVPALLSVYASQNYFDGSGHAFKIKWLSKNSVPFSYIRFIRNSHNSNNSINMCREFNEVDEFAARLLLEIIADPESAPEPCYNPFMPVGVLENWTNNSFHDNIIEQEGEDNDDEHQHYMINSNITGKRLDLNNSIHENDKNNFINLLSNFKEVSSLLKILPAEKIPENFNKCLAEEISIRKSNTISSLLINRKKTNKIIS